MAAGAPFDLRPAGMLALDVARIEAGLLLIEVDFFSCRKALIPASAVLALRDGPGPAGAARQGAVRRVRPPCGRSRRKGPRRQIVGLEVNWEEVEALYEKLDLATPGACVSVAGRGAGLPRRRTGRQSDVHHVVTGSQETDRAGDRRSRMQHETGSSASDGSDRRSGPASCRGEGRCRRRSSIPPEKRRCCTVNSQIGR